MKSGFPVRARRLDAKVFDQQVNHLLQHHRFGGKVSLVDGKFEGALSRAISQKLERFRGDVKMWAPNVARSMWMPVVDEKLSPT
jgi:hypothetical protein